MNIRTEFIFSSTNKRQSIIKNTHNHEKNTDNNRYYLCNLILRFVCCRSCRHFPWRMVAYWYGGNMLYHFHNVTKGGKAMPRRRLTPEERVESLERRRRQRREYMRRYYREHREERMRQTKDWQERHREAYKEYQREYQQRKRRRHGNV